MCRSCPVRHCENTKPAASALPRAGAVSFGLSQMRKARPRAVTIADLANQPLIVPERRLRPHSHDLTMKLFAEAGLEARIVQIADEKQTIVNLVFEFYEFGLLATWETLERSDDMFVSGITERVTVTIECRGTAQVRVEHLGSLREKPLLDGSVPTSGCFFTQP